MTSTGNHPQYIRHTYKVIKELKSYSIYDLVEVTGNKNLLTAVIRIEKYFGKSNASNINDYLRLRTSTNWSTSEQVTGLRPTIKQSLFYGDRTTTDLTGLKKRTLLLFTFLTDRQTLFIDVYRGFYPNHKGILQNIISTY